MKIVNKLKTLRHKAYITYFRHLPIQNNKVVMWADSQRHFGCSPKYIALCLLKKYPGQFDIVWVFDETVDVPVEIPDGIRIVKNFSMEYLKEIHTAKFVICNMRTYDGLYWHKRLNQVYIQTWHSYLRLKKIEGDAISSLGENYKNAAKRDSEKIDLLLSGCKFSTDIFKRAFYKQGKANMLEYKEKWSPYLNRYDKLYWSMTKIPFWEAWIMKNDFEPLQRIRSNEK